MESLARQLASVVGEAHVVTAAAELAPYLRDWRGRYEGKALCAVLPGNVDEVAAVVRLCAAARAPIVPQGGNTGLCGGATPDTQGCAVLLSLTRMNRILAMDRENLTITVEAGCTLQALKDSAQEAGLFFPLSLASQGSCTIGGNLSTNAGGVNVLRYGNTREQVLGLEVVLADGRIWNGLRGLRKDNTGYDLKQLFIGAEGTLGVVTRAVLKLYPSPQERATAWLAIDSPAAAVALLGKLQTGFGERVTGFELVGREALSLVLQHIPGSRDPLPGTSAPWYVLTELSDTRCGPELHSGLEALLADEMERGRILDAALASNTAQANAFWSLRENISEAQKREGFSIKHDVSVPVSRIAGFVEEAGKQLAQAFGAVRVVCFGHVGDGNLHYNLSQPLAGDSRLFLQFTEEANRIVHDLVTEAGGSISAEHGIGQLKRGELCHYKSDIEIELMQRVKAALDPSGLMNPGKIL